MSTTLVRNHCRRISRLEKMNLPLYLSPRRPACRFGNNIDNVRQYQFRPHFQLNHSKMGHSVDSVLAGDHAALQGPALPPQLQARLINNGEDNVLRIKRRPHGTPFTLTAHGRRRDMVLNQRRKVLWTPPIRLTRVNHETPPNTYVARASVTLPTTKN